MKEQIAYLGVVNVCRVWIQGENEETEPIAHAVLEKSEIDDTFSSLWSRMNDDEKSYVTNLLHEEKKWAEEENQDDHLFVYNRTLEVIKDAAGSQNFYFKKFIQENGSGKWNVIQVINGNARYYVLKDDISNPHDPFLLSSGWIEDYYYTDGEDNIDLTDWTREEGKLIIF